MHTFYIHNLPWKRFVRVCFIFPSTSTLQALSVQLLRGYSTHLLDPLVTNSWPLSSSFTFPNSHAIFFQCSKKENVKLCANRVSNSKQVGKFKANEILKLNLSQGNEILKWRELTLSSFIGIILHFTLAHLFFSELF